VLWNRQWSKETIEIQEVFCRGEKIKFLLYLPTYKRKKINDKNLTGTAFCKPTSNEDRDKAKLQALLISTLDNLICQVHVSAS
jgi:hypothetical protein